MARGVTVTGPTTNGTRPNVFGAPALDLEQHGYVAEEFFFEGDATAYAPARGADLGADGHWDLKPSRSENYKTRMLVLRPSSAQKFSGTVWVSWLNVTSGFETVELPPSYLREGDARVYVSAQKVGLDGFAGAESNGLRAWDPVRYGSLTHPGDDFSYDIFTQAAKLVGPQRGKLSIDPLHGLAVERLLANGTSQSAFRLASYLNGVQPLEKTFEGALLLVSFGWSARFQSQPSDAGDVDASVLRSAQIRDDLGIPVLLLTTESEAESLYPVRQPDSDTFRTWEIAGGAHASGAGGIPPEAVEVFLRDGLQIPGTGAAMPGGSEQAPINNVRWLPVLDAARQGLTTWISDGTPPPSLPLIAFAGDPPTIQRDEHGNARGGIRMPELEVPVATYRGSIEGAPRNASLFGASTPFPPEQLRALYPTRDDYLRAYDHAVDRGVTAGYFLARDAAGIKAAAAGKQQRSSRSQCERQVLTMLTPAVPGAP